MNRSAYGVQHAPPGQQAHARRATPRSLAGALAAAALLLLPLLSPTGNAVDTRTSVFAEPKTGRKVTQYSIELPVARNEERRFTIPDDCRAIDQAIASGAVHRGSVVGRRFWQKAEIDCHFDALLHRHAQRIEQDFVSGYDFMNARLEDLPIDPGCIPGAPTNCDPKMLDPLGLLRHFPMTQPPGTAGLDARCQPCQLNKGWFRGLITVSESGLRCFATTDASGLRLIAIDYADINGDGVLDAVLRLVPIGRGANRRPLILPLTRFAADAPFEVTRFNAAMVPMPREPRGSNAPD